jgi:hypothetical protein
VARDGRHRCDEAIFDTRPRLFCGVSSARPPRSWRGRIEGSLYRANVLRRAASALGETRRALCDAATTEKVCEKDSCHRVVATRARVPGELWPAPQRPGEQTPQMGGELPMQIRAKSWFGRRGRASVRCLAMRAARLMLRRICRERADVEQVSACPAQQSEAGHRSAGARGTEFGEYASRLESSAMPFARLRLTRHGWLRLFLRARSAPPSPSRLLSVRARYAHAYRPQAVARLSSRLLAPATTVRLLRGRRSQHHRRAHLEDDLKGQSRASVGDRGAIGMQSPSGARQAPRQQGLAAHEARCTDPTTRQNPDRGPRDRGGQQ